MQLVTEIYRSIKKEGLYLYVAKGTVLTDLPQVLVRRFGKAELTMTLLLTPERKLAHASATQVLDAIEQQGFYLQLPPGPGLANRLDASEERKLNH